MRIKNVETLTLQNDFLFCTVFTTNEKLLKELVEIITGRKVKEIKNLEKQKFQDFDVTSKAIRLDVSFEDEEGVIYHIEMEPTKKWNLFKRMRYYQSNSDALQISKGDYYDELRKTYIIFICGYDPFDKGLSKYTFLTKCNEVDVEFKDETVKIVLNTEGYRDNVSKKLGNLLDYFSGTIHEDDTFIQELDETVQQIKNNKEWRERYMTLEEKYALYLEDGKQRGIKQGIEIGEKRGEKKGEKRGLNKGIKKTIMTFVDSRRKDGYTEEEIQKEVQHIFSMDIHNILNK